MPKRNRWEPVFHGGATRTNETEQLPQHPRSAATGVQRPEFVPYVRRELDDERCAREAAAKLAAIRAKLPPEWHAWHASRRPLPTKHVNATELRWLRFWREAV